jgi:hypothetical protein
VLVKRIILLCLVFVSASALAQIYKRIGPDGQVYFSDQPGAGAEQVDLPPVQTISLPPVPAQTDTAVQAGSAARDAQDNPPAAYSEFAISSPTSEQGVRANNGDVTIHLSLQPALRPGHSIEVSVNGEDGEAVYSTDSMMLELKNMSRGRHTAAATVVDANGEALIQASPVTFYVLRVALGNKR